MSFSLLLVELSFKTFLVKQTHWCFIENSVYKLQEYTYSVALIFQRLWLFHFVMFILVQFSCSLLSDSLQPHGLQHARLPCPSPIPKACSNSCPLSGWCHQIILSSFVPFSCFQSFPASGSFQMSQFFTLGGQSIGVSASASVLPMNTQDWYPLG